MKHLSLDDQLLINRWAQELESNSSALGLFARWSGQREVLLGLVSELCKQASPTDGDIPFVLANVPFQATRPAGVILCMGVNADVFNRLRRLGGQNAQNAQDAFWVFMYLFRVADARRRHSETNCRHWWHMDLTNPEVVQWIRDEYSAGRL